MYRIMIKRGEHDAYAQAGISVSERMAALAVAAAQGLGLWAYYELI